MNAPPAAKAGESGAGSLEFCTRENFDVPRYLAANADILAFVDAGGNATEHFLAFGQKEGRSQLTKKGMGEHEIQAVLRFNLLAPVLDAKAGGGKPFTFARNNGRFPILYGGAGYDLATYASESAGAGFGPFIEQVTQHPDRIYADIGCGRREIKYNNCLYVEVYASQSADLIMQPDNLYPIKSGSLDGIGCFAVLEHVPKPWLVAEEFRRILKPGGQVFIDWPFLQPVHGYPSHYYNATRDGLRALFDEGFDLELAETLPHQGPDHSLTWYLLALIADLADTDPAMADRLRRSTVAELVSHPPGSRFWTDILAFMTPHARMVLACGNSLIARKR